MRIVVIGRIHLTRPVRVLMLNQSCAQQEGCLNKNPAALKMTLRDSEGEEHKSNRFFFAPISIYLVRLYMGRFHL